MNFYGDSTRWFVARVIDNKDHWKGRVKIRIIGLHSEEVPNKDLPWAKCMLPTTEGGTSGIGKIPQVLNGAFVFGMFLDGVLSQNPIVLGSLSHNEIPSSVQKRRAGSNNTILSESYVIDGVILDPNLVTMYNFGQANLETRAVIAMQFLRDAGLTNVKAAAGVVGNLIGESNIVADGPIGGVGEEGIAQWNPKVGRLQLLQQYAKENNRSYRDFFTQLHFLVHDMKTSQGHRVWPHLSNNSISHEYELDVPYSMQNNTNATYYFLKEYEVPADVESALIKRQEHAAYAYDVYIESQRVTKLAAKIFSPGAQ